jgi:hypothetical protein
LLLHTRAIITSGDFISAAAVWPLRNCILRTASAVMMDQFQPGDLLLPDDGRRVLSPVIWGPPDFLYQAAGIEQDR